MFSLLMAKEKITKVPNVYFSVFFLEHCHQIPCVTHTLTITLATLTDVTATQ